MSIDCCVVFSVATFMLSLYSSVHHLCDQKKVHFTLQISNLLERESHFLESVEIILSIYSKYVFCNEL